MSHFHYFDASTGVLHEKELSINLPLAKSEDVAKANCPAGHTPIEGNFDRFSQRIDVASGKALDYQPPTPGVDHEWNTTTKRWQLTAAIEASNDADRSARAQIATLEASQPRVVREMLLDMPGAAERLKSIDAQISTLRASLALK